MKYTYDVDLHFEDGWDTYTVSANHLDGARFMAIQRAVNETGRTHANSIDCIRVYRSGTDRLLKEYSV